MNSIPIQCIPVGSLGIKVGSVQTRWNDSDLVGVQVEIMDKILSGVLARCDYEIGLWRRRGSTKLKSTCMILLCISGKTTGAISWMVFILFWFRFLSLKRKGPKLSRLCRICRSSSTNCFSNKLPSTTFTLGRYLRMEFFNI